MTCRLQLLGVLLAAAAVTSGSPLPQYSASDVGTGHPPATPTPGADNTTSATPDAETSPLSTVQPTEAAESPAESLSESPAESSSESPAESPAETPAASSAKPAEETVAEMPAEGAGNVTDSAEAEKMASEAEKNGTGAPAEMLSPEEGSTESSLPEITTAASPDSGVTDTATTTTTIEPTTEPSQAPMRIKGGRQTTSRPGFTDDDMLVSAPVCTAILNSSLSPPTFKRHNSSVFTTCRCVDRKQAICQPETSYPTVRPGSASAAHAQEQSSNGRSPAVLAAQAAANAFALHHDCQQRGKNGAICLLSKHGRQLYCDCAEEM